MRHRILVYWGVRDDPELEDRWTTQGVDRRTQLIGLPVGVAAVVCTITLVDLFVSLVTGAGVDPGAAISDGVRLAFGMFGLLVVASIVLRLVGRLRARSRR